MAAGSVDDATSSSLDSGLGTQRRAALQRARPAYMVRNHLVRIQPVGVHVVVKDDGVPVTVPAEEFSGAYDPTFPRIVAALFLPHAKLTLMGLLLSEITSTTTAAPSLQKSKEFM